MGQATIISGGANGRYTIQVDYGENIKTAALAALSVLLARLDVRLAEAQNIFNQAQARVDAQQTAYQAAVDAFATAYKQILPGEPFPDDRVIVDALKELRKRQMELIPFRTQLEAVKLERVKTLKDIASWNQVQTVVTKPAWCADFTEDVAPGSWVATIDVSGESALTLVYPGGRQPTASDGRMTTTAVMSPSQSAFNFAIFPGWQKFKPTYRRGVITTIDYDANTATVTLDAAQSSAQRLNINRQTVLNNVPVTYMDCNAQVFEVGDRVVVQFDGQSWDSPRLIGFLDNPRPCTPWPQVAMTLTYEITSISSNGSRYWGEVRLQTPCGYSWLTRGTKDCALSATHAISLSAPDFLAPQSLFHLEIDGGIFNDPLWTGTSSAFDFNVAASSSTKPPAAGASVCESLQAFAPPLADDELLSVVKYSSSFVDSLTLPTNYSNGAFCVVDGTDTAGAWSSTNTLPTVAQTNVIGPISALEWLQSIGAAPLIIVRRGEAGARRVYELESVSSTEDDFDSTYNLWRKRRWNLYYRPGAYL